MERGDCNKPTRTIVASNREKLVKLANVRLIEVAVHAPSHPTVTNNLIQNVK